MEAAGSGDTLVSGALPMVPSGASDPTVPTTDWSSGVGLGREACEALGGMRAGGGAAEMGVCWWLNSKVRVWGGGRPGGAELTCWCCSWRLASIRGSSFS